MSKRNRAPVVKSILQHVKETAWAEGRQEGYWQGAQLRSMQLDEAQSMGQAEGREEAKAHWSIYLGFMCTGAAMTAIIMGYLI